MPIIRKFTNFLFSDRQDLIAGMKTFPVPLWYIGEILREENPRFVSTDFGSTMKHWELWQPDAPAIMQRLNEWIEGKTSWQQEIK